MPIPSPEEQITVIVEVRSGGFLKRGPLGTIDFLSPVPCPFNYGSVEGSLAADGEPQDAIVLGKPLLRLVRVRCTPVAVVRFVDGGVRDDKWVCRPVGEEGELTAPERQALVRFFRLYGATKRLWGRLRGRAEVCRFDGIEVLARCAR